MFAVDSDGKSEFLCKAKQARQDRAAEKRREQASVCIQAAWRGYICRKLLFAELRSKIDATFGMFAEVNKSAQLLEAEKAFTVARTLLFVYKEAEDKERFFSLCRYLICSVESSDSKTSFVALAMNKTYLVEWVRLVKCILWRCCCFPDLKLDLPLDAKIVNLLLHVLVLFTSPNAWAVLKNKQAAPFKPAMNQMCNNIMSHLITKGIFLHLKNLLRKGLCRKQPILKHAALSAVLSLAVRALLNENFSESCMNMFIVNILSVPSLILNLEDLAQECLAVLMTNKLLLRSLQFISSEQSNKPMFSSLDGTNALCLLANIIHLGYLEKACLVENLLDFANVVTKLLEKCRAYVVNNKSVVTAWHPVLGWFSQSFDSGLNDAMPKVEKQLQYLWCSSMVKCLFSDLVNLIPETLNSTPSVAASESGRDLAGPVKSLFKRVVEHSKRSSKTTKCVVRSPQTTVVAVVCSVYQSALSTLTQLRYDILSGLCYQDFLLPRLWGFISTLGAQWGLKAFLELLEYDSKATCAEFHILILFCDAATYLVNILDDIELYEREKPFSLQLLNQMAFFTNTFVFKSIWENLIDVKSVGTSSLYQSVHNFLMLLYNRDSRRNFTGNSDIWLIRDIKPSTFLSELEKSNPRATFLLQKVPHIIPHTERVVLFRKNITLDKEGLGLHRDGGSNVSSYLITIHRSRVVEDGYRQLSLLPINSLKGVIRVKFINEQGLDEPGIDQDGVFKEFLEETIKRVFDPSLNLFKETSDGRLYPSPTSNIHENHLALFDFVGRMLAKAVYEGIVVEVPLATFVLNHVLGRTSGLMYSSVDELPSLDPELYKNLTYIKHYDGDVADLSLTFSCDEDYMGQMITHELVPGGRTVGVTNENKISYIHHMAHFRMYVQIKDQLTAFVRGFRSLIRTDWLSLFSAPELQKLISGDCEDFDLEDLKSHVQYYGGFHGGHRVILWLWDILKNDFSAAERRMFLKFVTSCSKPPLLGFAYLEPPFSIRCVEVSDDQDTGDTLGSVIRGFLAVRRKDPIGRLPTSSTCFNLLKLPNYQKKSTLREKLRYAITSGTGFELS